MSETKTKRAEWKQWSGSPQNRHELDLGAVSGIALPGDGERRPSWGIGTPRGTADSLDQAMGIAEAKLLDIRDALNAHFAPVLRWEGERAELALSSGATWRLYADRWNYGGSCVVPGLSQPIAEFRASLFDSLPQGSVVETRACVERTLRALGVVFRTEGE